MIRCRSAVLAFLFFAAMFAGGCNISRSLFYQTAPTKEKVEPEYAGLVGKKAVVYVWAPPEVLWDYPHIRVDLGALLGSYLRDSVKGVQVEDAMRVETFLRGQTSTNPDPTEIGRQFHADVVIQVSVYKFSLRDPGMSQFYRGRLSSSIVVHERGAKDEPAKRVPLKDVNTVVPEEGPLGYHNVPAEQVRDMTYRAFTQTAGRKFHEWERELD